MALDFVTMEMRVQYPPNAAIPAAMSAATPADRELNIAFLEGRDRRTLLQSPTNSTKGEVRADGTNLVTQYYGDFVAPGRHDLRKEYTTRKLHTLLDWLTRAKIRPDFLGLIATARIRVDRAQRENAVSSVVAGFGLPALVASDRVYDFVVRASEAAAVAEEEDPWCFANAQLSWFQTRQLSLSPSELASFPADRLVFRDWDLKLVEEGLEIKFDLNNKRALRNGRRIWATEDHLAMANAMFDWVPRTQERIMSTLLDHGFQG